MNSLAVLAVLAVATVQAMPQVLPQATPDAQAGAVAAVPQIQSNLPGLIFPSQLMPFQSPFLAQVPGAAGQPSTFQHVFPLTSFVVRPLTDAEQNALAHQEFQRIWEAQATRNLAIPQLQAAVAAKATTNAAGQTTAPEAAPAAAPVAPAAAPVSNNVL